MCTLLAVRFNTSTVTSIWARAPAGPGLAPPLLVKAVWGRPEPYNDRRIRRGKCPRIWLQLGHVNINKL